MPLKVSFARRRYGCSKWASEVQLQQLHERHGAPVSIFRCGMVLAHSKCAPALPPPLCCHCPRGQVLAGIFPVHRDGLPARGKPHVPS